MRLTEVLNLVPDSEMIRIKDGKEELFTGYKGLLEEGIEGEVIKIRIVSEVWKRERRCYGLHKGEINLVGKIAPEEAQMYNFKDLTVMMILELNIQK